MPRDGLAAFFALAGPWLRGDVPPDALRALGPTPATDADLAFYPLLSRQGWSRVMRELYGPLASVIEARGGPQWDELCSSFFQASPPGGYVLQAMGAPFPGWIERELAGATFADPALDGAATTAGGLAALADYLHCRSLARHAVDGPGLALDERVFVRRYPVDVAAWARDPHARVGRAVTLCVFRSVDDDSVDTLAPTVATMAVFAALAGVPRTGALAIPDAELIAEHARLVARGVVRGDARIG